MGDRSTFWAIRIIILIPSINNININIRNILSILSILSISISTILSKRTRHKDKDTPTGMGMGMEDRNRLQRRIRHIRLGWGNIMPRLRLLLLLRSPLPPIYIRARSP
jgi:hypothetical protein